LRSLKAGKVIDCDWSRSNLKATAPSTEQLSPLEVTSESLGSTDRVTKPLDKGARLPASSNGSSA